MLLFGLGDTAVTPMSRISRTTRLRLMRTPASHRWLTICRLP